MSYTIGFQAKDQKAILATEAATANQAVAIIAALRQSADEIKFIRSPQEGEMGHRDATAARQGRGRGDAAAGVRHDPENCAAVFPRDKRGTGLRGDYLKQKLVIWNASSPH
ncbi:hypothetical protein ACVWZ3_004814 [Bradyrhizobium sp. i1.3.6]